MDNEAVLRDQLLALLRGGQAHMGFEAAVADFPMALINVRPPNVTYTPWHVVEHMRIAQWDILEFVRNPGHVSPDWPKGYWPDPESQASPAQWAASLAAFRKDLRDVESLAADPRTDLFSVIPHGSGQTILREIMLVGDHNAYHIGELGLMRQTIQAWPRQRSEG
ncbi:MAG TPA: DinB family protein [Aggregatilineaceae bacterium]|nr:DinB family protein [Aggregatilineaceae bacterium]